MRQWCGNGKHGARRQSYDRRDVLVVCPVRARNDVPRQGIRVEHLWAYENEALILSNYIQII